MEKFPLPDLEADEGEAARPKYERLREHFLSEMHEGRLKPGTALPSEQRLAEQFGVARNTVRQTLAALEQEGIVSRVQGKGTFIQEQVLQKVRNQTGLLAFIVPETQAGFYPSLLKSFHAAADKISHQVIVCHTNNEIDRQGNAILQLIDREVAGVAIVPTTTPATPAYQIRQLQKHDIPVVFCSRRVEDIQAPWVAIPFERVGFLAGEAIAKAGHRRVAFFGTHPTHATFAYEAGFRKALQKLTPGEVEIEAFFGEDSNPAMASHEQSVAQALNRIVYQNPHPPTAIFAGYDPLAELIYLQLTKAGYRVPEDISLISFGGNYRSSAMLRQLTAVTIDENFLAERAVEQLELMRTGKLNLQATDFFEIPLDIYPGETLGIYRPEKTVLNAL